MLTIFDITIDIIEEIRNPAKDLRLTDIVPGLLTAIGFLWSLMLAVFVIMTNSLITMLKNGNGNG